MADDHKHKEGEACPVHGQQPLRVEIPPELEVGAYANAALVTHSDSEMCIDFAFLLPNTMVAKIVARVVTAPIHVKRLIRALQDNLDRYEKQHGAVVLPEDAMRAPGDAGKKYGWN